MASIKDWDAWKLLREIPGKNASEGRPESRAKDLVPNNLVSCHFNDTKKRVMTSGSPCRHPRPKSSPKKRQNHQVSRTSIIRPARMTYTREGPINLEKNSRDPCCCKKRAIGNFQRHVSLVVKKNAICPTRRTDLELWFVFFDNFKCHFNS